MLTDIGKINEAVKEKERCQTGLQYIKLDRKTKNKKMISDLDSGRIILLEKYQHFKQRFIFKNIFS